MLAPGVTVSVEETILPFPPFVRGTMLAIVFWPVAPKVFEEKAPPPPLPVLLVSAGELAEVVTVDAWFPVETTPAVPPTAEVAPVNVVVPPAPAEVLVSPLPAAPPPPPPPYRGTLR